MVHGQRLGSRKVCIPRSRRIEGSVIVEELGFLIKVGHSLKSIMPRRIRTVLFFIVCRALAALGRTKVLEPNSNNQA